MIVQLKPNAFFFPLFYTTPEHLFLLLYCFTSSIFYDINSTASMRCTEMSSMVKIKSKPPANSTSPSPSSPCRLPQEPIPVALALLPTPRLTLQGRVVVCQPPCLVGLSEAS